LQKLKFLVLQMFYLVYLISYANFIYLLISGSALIYIRRDPRQRRSVRGRHSTDTGATGAADAPEDNGAVHRPRRLAAKRLASQDPPRGTLHINEEAELPGTSTDDETEEGIKEDEPSERPSGWLHWPTEYPDESPAAGAIKHPLSTARTPPNIEELESHRGGAGCTVRRPHCARVRGEVRG
jgi:hypothetical protein